MPLFLAFAYPEEQNHVNIEKLVSSDHHFLITSVIKAKKPHGLESDDSGLEYG